MHIGRCEMSHLISCLPHYCRKKVRHPLFLREIACPTALFSKLKGKKSKEFLISVGERNLKKRKEDHHKEVERKLEKNSALSGIEPRPL